MFESFKEAQSSIEEEIGSTTEGEQYHAEVEELYYTTMANCKKIIKKEEPAVHTNNAHINSETFNYSAAGSNQMVSLNSLDHKKLILFWVQQSFSNC